MRRNRTLCSHSRSSVRLPLMNAVPDITKAVRIR